MLLTLSKSHSNSHSIILPIVKGKIDHERLVELTGLDITFDFEGDFKEQQVIYHPKTGKRIYLLGLGEEKDSNRLRDAFRSLAFKHCKDFEAGLQLDGLHLSQKAVEEAVIGLELATYRIGAHKTESELSDFYKDDFEVVIISDQIDKSLLKKAQDTGNSMKHVLALVDAPANVKTPQYLAQWAKDSAKKYGYTCEIFEKEKLQQDGFGALIAVGQGSIHEPVLITLEHKPKDASSEVPELALIGKGITFDTGGISIKGSQNMHYMKSDMGGAGAVLGAVELAARLDLPIHVVGIVASAENAVDANSFKPGDVITSYSGKTIEIIDTDAEGRLVLADAINYAVKNYQPKHIIDLATLTGNCVMALGYSAAGMFTKNEALAEKLQRVGEDIYERVWPLPLFDEFKSDVFSDIADVRNFSGKPIAGAITAAKFLEVFTEEHECWMHLDIAGVAFGDSEYSKMKSASAYGVRLMVEFMKAIAEPNT
ncbi:MAG: leucyl aminopeptidase family protein [Bacteroidota bacterium]